MIKKYYLIVILLILSSSLTVPAVHATGSGFMIAIIVTSDDPTLENELAVYDKQAGLPACTRTNGCLEVAKPFGTAQSNYISSSDVSYFVEQAHQANPTAKILVVEAKSISWQDKWNAAHYAEKLPNVEKVTSVSYSIVLMELGLVLKQG